MWGVGVFAFSGLTAFLGQFVVSGFLGHLSQENGLVVSFGITAIMVALTVSTSVSLMLAIGCFAGMVRKGADARIGAIIAASAALAAISFPFFSGVFDRKPTDAETQPMPHSQNKISSFDQIKRGMDVDQVIAILGKPDQWDRENGRVYYYYAEGIVEFSQDGRVTEYAKD